MPSLDIEGGLWLALVRGAWDTALLSLLGTLVFRAVVVPRATARAEPSSVARFHHLLVRLSWWSLGVAVVAAFGWWWLQAAAIAGTADLASAVAVAQGTVFGRLLILQLVFLAVTAPLLISGRTARARLWLALGVVVVTTSLEAGHGHSFAQDDGVSLLVAAASVHLMAAGVWIGGLLPLCLAVYAAPAKVGALAARWFSPLGKGSVALMAITAAVQAWALVGSLPGAIGTAYGWAAIAKFILFVVLLAFAWANRYRFAPRLMGPDGEASRRVLLRSIAVQTGFGLLVVLVAAILGSLPPTIHEQPVWPFSLRPSLVALSDPDLRAEVVRGILEVSVAVTLVLLAVVLWPRRLLAAAAVVAGLSVGAAAWSHLDLLLVEAYPTSYASSPTGFAATSITRGASLYGSNCASCHGVDGRGDGPAAGGLPVPPADLTAGHLWEHADGELFWWLTHGIEAPNGTVAMPGFAGRLSEDDRWALIDDIRAHNAGVGLRDTGAWTVPVPAPGFTSECPGRGSVTTDDLRGTVLHIVVPLSGTLAIPPVPERSPVPVTTIVLTDRASPASACVNADPAVRAAFAILAGVPTPDLAGTQFLVDPNGWMRAVQRPGDTTVRWADPALLLADVRAICAHPIAAPAGGHVHH